MGKNDPYHGGLAWEHLNKRCKNGCPYCCIAELKAENKELKKDAERWRYTQREDYFYTGPYNNYRKFTGYSVGIQPKGATVNESITGRGRTLKKAIDKALEQEKK